MRFGVWEGLKPLGRTRCVSNASFWAHGMACSYLVLCSPMQLDKMQEICYTSGENRRTRQASYFQECNMEGRHSQSGSISTLHGKAHRAVPRWAFFFQETD